MAREYNAKYNSTNVLSSNNAEINEVLKENLNNKKEKLKLDIEKDFENFSSLFYFLKVYINRLDVSNFNYCKNFCNAKLEEIKNKLETFKQRIFNIIK